MFLKIEKIVPVLKPQTIIGDVLWASSGYNVYNLDLNGTGKTLVGKIPVKKYKEFMNRSRIISRFLRMGIYSINKISKDKILIACDKGFYVIDSKFHFVGKVDLSIKSFQLLDHSICVSPDFIYYGEYFPNVSRQEIKIYRSKTSSGLDWGVVYTFPKKSIKHIHLLQYDPFYKKIWFSSGDSNEECRLGYARPDFSDVCLVGNKNQKWRTLELLFTKEKVFWGTDSPQNENKLLAYSRKSEELEEIARFDGPIYNLRKIGTRGYIIVTATEKGTGEWDNKAHLWYSSNLYDWYDCVSYSKDNLPNIFGFGRIILSKNMESKIFFSGLGLKEIDNKMIVADISIG